MAHRRRVGGGPDGERGTRPGDPAAELEAVLDELEVRFLLDPDTRFETVIEMTADAAVDTRLDCDPRPHQ